MGAPSTCSTVALLLCWALAGCSVATEQPAASATARIVRPAMTASPTATTSDPTQAPATPTAIPTSTPRPTHTPRPSATTPALPSPTLTACTERIPSPDDLLTIVTRDFGLSRDYVPQDLVPLNDTFPNSVTLGYPTEVRQILIEPLQKIVSAMQEAGLRPQIISGYRSYAAQGLAMEKWLEQYPDWAGHLSAPPGHSEHQLGTTVDFGSPELSELIGAENIQFHPAFDQTGEGRWLAENAHNYGFTMSYPENAFERTEFYYEPWHFRYVGVDLATALKEQELTISEYLLQQRPQPCLP